MTTVENVQKLSWVNPTLYEPNMLAAYEQEEPKKEKGKGEIEIVSLKDWPAKITPLAKMQVNALITALAFANKGQWLMAGQHGANGYALTI